MKRFPSIVFDFFGGRGPCTAGNLQFSARQRRATSGPYDGPENTRSQSTCDGFETLECRPFRAVKGISTSISLYMGRNFMVMISIRH